MKSKRFGRVPFFGGFLALVIALTAMTDGRLAPSFSPVPAAASVEEATPDCGVVAPDADPPCRRALHLSRLGAEKWHAAGFRGKDVKIAVLDTGFRGYQDQLGKTLPEHVTTRSFRTDGKMEARDSQHGILCSEVLHALAPDASLLLATWDPDSSAQFLQAVQWARDQGAQIISCSVIMPSWSDGEGGGLVHEALAKAIGTGAGRGDLLYFASAGNTARRHWSGMFHDGGDGFHEWTAGQIDNPVRPWNSDRVSIELCGQSANRYQVVVNDATTGTEIGRSTCGGNANRCCSVVRFMPASGHRYRVRVRLSQGPAKPFHLVALGGDLDCATAPGSIPFPGDGPEVVAIGAIDDDGQRVSYSSCGPNSTSPKPDFVAPVPFPSLWRDRPFSGTSAAAPQAAGLAALCWSHHPDWTAAKVRSFLQSSAKDLGPPGHDCETGYGMVLLPAP